MKDIITVAAVNFKVDAANKESNLSRMCGFLEAAACRGADLVLFPEMCLMGYDYYVDEKVSQEEKIRNTELITGPSCSRLAEITKAKGVYTVFGMAEKLEDKPDAFLYNSAVAIGPEGVIGSYKKMHPFETESIWCVKGSEPFMFDTPWGPVSIGICFDTYQFPELQRYYCGQGSRLYLNPTAVVEEIPKEGSRQAFIDYYAPTLEYGVLCNTIYVASANLCGMDDVNYFGGGSCIIGPKITPFYETNVHYYAGSKDNVQEGIVMETIDLSLAARRLFVDKELTGEPDYRPDIYKQFL
ncbi:MAG: carbon-nitrogen hydrolase family protein [Clostridiales bacterium]|nr:carbon-nitrogen hydrolase family protein [Clostridiales bacterium]MDD7035418.1 carbon-nitrogen hydrolase family protein [Bacillota bacterium]MDY2920778.1 carbon-nitrogen hydrolase family protein [Lentihominibacter sp.]